MDVIFNCPECDQELEVDSAGAGTEINCPSCGELILIPGPEGAKKVVDTPPEEKPAKPAETSAAAQADEVHPVNPIASSAAAKEEKHFSVPVHDKAVERLIEKPLPPLDSAAAAEAGTQLKVKCIKRGECMEVGHDKFDEVVTNFLRKVGESNIVSITTLSYSHIDSHTEKLLNDYGVMIVYRG